MLESDAAAEQRKKMLGGAVEGRDDGAVEGGGSEAMVVGTCAAGSGACAVWSGNMTDSRRR